MPSSDKQTVIGFITLALVGAIGWWLITALVSSLSGMESPVAAALIAAVATVATVSITVYRDRSKARQEVHREEKVKTYLIFVDLMFRLLRASKSGGSERPPSDAELQDTMMSLMRGVIFYGSPAVLVALNRWRLELGKSPTPYETLGLIGDVLLAIRSDIGLSNAGIDRFTIHQVYLTDDVRELKKGTQL